MVQNTEITVNAATGTAFTYRGVKPGEDIRYCNCGCNLQVVKKAIYRPGHDARHVSQLAVAIEEVTLATSRKSSLTKAIREAFEVLPSAKLKVKLATRLFKTLGEQHADMVTNLLGASIEADEDEDSDES